MFPKGFPYEMQVYISIFSVDGENDADVLGMIGASAALCLSDIPFAGPLGAVRVGRVDGEMVINPTRSNLEESDIDLIVSGTDVSIASVEGGAQEITEADLLSALRFGHEQIQIAPGGSLDLYVSGRVGSVGFIELGDPTDPSAFRLYIADGGRSPIQIGAEKINGAIYAPNATVTWIGYTRLNGAVLAKNVDGPNVPDVDETNTIQVLREHRAV